MAIPGPKPKPTDLKILHGARPDRINTRAPRPVRITPTPPRWLGKEARAEWKRITPELERTGLLSQLDRAALITYCEAWQTLVEAQEEIHERGVLVQGYRGGVVKNPALQVARDSAQTIRGFCSEFGLTPSSRSRLVVHPDLEDDDDLD